MTWWAPGTRPGLQVTSTPVIHLEDNMFVQALIVLLVLWVVLTLLGIELTPRQKQVIGVVIVCLLLLWLFEGFGFFVGPVWHRQL
jgi:ABC-type polysaccharide/polyol phosphate export permease